MRYIGCSNLKAWQLARYLQLADGRLLARFVSIQPVFNALNRGIEAELLPLCELEGIGVIAYNPLAGGMLTAKYGRGRELPRGSRLDAFDAYRKRYHTSQTFEIVEAFAAWARGKGCTPAQLALAWVMADQRVTCPILGARSTSQFEDSIQGAELALSPDERSEIPAIRAPFWVGTDPVYDQ